MQKKVEGLLENEIRPLLRSHGGDVRLVDCREGVVSLELLGSCAGCPSADLGTRQTIEETLRKHLPEIERVELCHAVDPDMLEFARKILRHEA